MKSQHCTCNLIVGGSWSKDTVIVLEIFIYIFLKLHYLLTFIMLFMILLYHPSFFILFPTPGALPNPSRQVLGDTIMFRSVQMGSSAVYQCNASNQHGYLLANAFVSVLGEIQNGVVVSAEHFSHWLKSNTSFCTTKLYSSAYCAHILYVQLYNSHNVCINLIQFA